MSKKMTFEEALHRLEEIAQQLESGDVPLEESIKMYEEGMKLIDFCTQKLNEAEKKVQKLIKGEQGDFRTEPFETTTDNS